jgi:benzylsuccinate CoA-transferase BbsE subunit
MYDAAIKARIDETGEAWSAPEAGRNETPAALAGIRVLDLSGLAGQYCGKQFADLGADVILIEPVGGSPVRREGPFLDDRAHVEFSLQFAYFNAGKRGAAIDLNRPEGQRIARQLAKDADLIIESERPGVMSTTYAGGLAIFGGSAQFVATSVVAYAGDPRSIAGIFALATAMSLLMFLRICQQTTVGLRSSSN